MNQLTQYQIGLSLLPMIGAINAKKLLAHCGNAEDVFRMKKKDLVRIPGIGSIIADEVLNSDVLGRAEEEMNFIIKNNIQTVFYTDENYPERLKHCIDSPVMLYYKGNISLNHPKSIAIVGTRNATDYGKSNCEKIIEELKELDVLIVSGLAYGVDICAHKSALDNGLKTIAVLGHGLDMVYPAIHKEIAVRIEDQGGLLSEYMSKTIPDKGNFPMRNRIVAGMVDAVLVIESGKKGGAMITADIANSYNRDVFALPGRISDSMSKGCNHLIKTNRAALIESAEDIKYLMGWESKKKAPKSIQKELFIELPPDENKLYEIIKKHEEIGIDDIFVQSEMPMSKISALLLSLEFEGIIKSLPGKRYRLN